jgi:hypothetical protein
MCPPVNGLFASKTCFQSLVNGLRIRKHRNFSRGKFSFSKKTLRQIAVSARRIGAGQMV